MKKFKIIFLTSIVLVLIFHSCNKLVPDGEPDAMNEIHIALIDAETQKNLFDTIIGAEYHLDSVKLFNQIGERVDVYHDIYVNRNGTTHIGDIADGVAGLCITFNPFNMLVKEFEERYNQFDSVFYLYLNRHDTDTIIYHYYTDTIIDNQEGDFVKIEYLNYMPQQTKFNSEVILIGKK